MTHHSEPQQTPKANLNDTIISAVVRDLGSNGNDILIDLLERAESGKSKYGVYLQPFNGRNALIDLYQEVLDGIMYSKQAIVENEQADGDPDTRLAIIDVHNTLIDIALFVKEAIND